MEPEVKPIRTSLVRSKQPSTSYRLSGHGAIDGREAMEQAILLILSIERYDYAIYSPDYGLEMNELYGRSVYYVFPELKSRITEALMQDDRVLDVRDFSYVHRGGSIVLTFVVDTDVGPIAGQKEVTLA